MSSSYSTLCGLFLITAISCAAPRPAVHEAQSVQTVYDPYLQQTTISTRPIENPDQEFGISTYQLIAILSQERKIAVLGIRFVSVSDDWIEVIDVRDSSGMKIPFHYSEKRLAAMPESAPSTVEDITLLLSDQYLEAHRSSGIDIVLIGNRRIPIRFLGKQVAEFNEAARAQIAASGLMIHSPK